jgi:hypothetical protein
MDAAIALPRGVHEVAVTGPDGTRRVRQVIGRRLEVPAARPGRYRVDGDGFEAVFCANFLALEESDLGRCVRGEWGTWTDSRSVQESFVSTRWLFLLSALGVLVGHQVLAVRAGGQI